MYKTTEERIEELENNIAKLVKQNGMLSEGLLSTIKANTTLKQNLEVLSKSHTDLGNKTLEISQHLLALSRRVDAGQAPQAPAAAASTLINTFDTMIRQNKLPDPVKTMMVGAIADSTGLDAEKLIDGALDIWRELRDNDIDIDNTKQAMFLVTNTEMFQSGLENLELSDEAKEKLLKMQSDLLETAGKAES